MKRENERIKNTLLTGRFADAARANRAFHMIIIDGSDNPELIKIIKRVKIKIRRLGTYYFSSHRIIPSSTIAEHEQLIMAIGDQDVARAKSILTQHWEHVAERVRDAARG
jgi:DNA-binding GntR family transcriptional regulator